MRSLTFQNFVAYQIGWFACILGAARGLPWLGTIATIVIVAWHLSRSVHPRRELTLVLMAAAIGALWETLMLIFGWVEYPNGALIAGTAPHWMVALWMGFATTLNASLAWLKRSMPLAIVFGALGGPLSYHAGVQLGAVVFVDWWSAMIALAIGWAVLTPLLLDVARRNNGFLPTLSPEAQHA